MKSLIFFLLVACMNIYSVEAQMTLQESFVFEGKSRTYRIYFPANYIQGSVRPVIFHFHGYSQTAANEQSFSKWMPVADTAGFLVVYPNGLMDPFHSNNQYWNVGWSWLPKTNDIGFVSALIDTVHARHNTDTQRVYASGMSNGGFMAFLLGANLSNKIAAVASVSGGIVPSVYDTLVPKRPIPTLAIHGTADNLVPYNGSGGMFASVPVDSVFAFWGLHNQCTPEVDTTYLPNLATGDGSTVVLFEFKNESCLYDSRLYRIVGGGHVDWPGSSVPGNQDINACSEIWNFFNTYTLDTVVSAEDPHSDDAISLSLYPVPVLDEVTISLNQVGDFHDPILVTIVNTMGEVIQRGKINSGESTITVNMKTNTPGMYFVVVTQGRRQTVYKLLKV
jgi:polyhydroxybutyrate depolymerase